jgi:hypothetical protein
MTEKRKYHLSYCKICKNKLLNIKVGIECGITNQIANFEQSCQDYKLDSKELINLQEKNNGLIEEKYHSNNFFNKVILGSYLNKDEKIISERKKIESKKEFGIGNKFFRILFAVFTSFLIYFVGINYEQFFKGSTEMEKNVGLIFLVSSCLCLFYFGFIQKYKPEVVFYKDFMEYNNREFIFKKQKRKIFWNDIINLRLFTIEGEGGSTEKIIVGTTSNGIKEINATYFDTNAKEFMTLIRQRAINVV